MANYISQVTLPSGDTYDIKDASAWTQINNLWSSMSHSLVLEKVNTLPTADSTTTGKIYLVPDNTHDPSTNDIFDEYITIDNGASANPRYTWEKIGNTDVNLSNYSVKTHTHTVDISIGVNDHSYKPTGSVSASFSGTSFNSTGSYKPTGSVAINASTNRTATVSPTSVTTQNPATYTPRGTVSQPTFSGSAATITVSGTVSGSASASIGSVEGHTHTQGGTTKYLHYTTQVPKTFTTQAGVVTGISTAKLATTTIKGVSGSTTASKATPGTAVNIAKPGTEKSYSTISTNNTGSVTVTLQQADRATGSLNNDESSTRSGTNQVMYNASVNGEVLYFTMKTMACASTATGTVSSASTDATKTVYTNSSITGINGSVSYTPYTFADVTVPIADNSSTTVATGNTSTNGGATIATGSSGTATVLKAVDTSVTLLNDTVDTQSSNGIAFIQSLNANTGSGGGHTHSADITFSGGTIQSTGSYTPTGTVSQPTFDGSATRLVTENINVPTGFSFTGDTSTITVSGTATGSVSATFTGDTSTIKHTVTGNGTKTTSQASA